MVWKGIQVQDVMQQQAGFCAVGSEFLVLFIWLSRSHNAVSCISCYNSFFNTSTAGRGVQVDLYPTCIQAQCTVRASKLHEISNHITRHSAVNISQICSIQVTIARQYLDG
jgi:hypothetical protein